MKHFFCLLALVLLPHGLLASRLNSDPDVVYLEDFAKEPLILLTVRDTPIHLAKNGGRRIGHIAAQHKIELLAMTDKAYRIKGPGRNGQLVGWTSPKFLASQDPEFVSNLKKLYQRQMAVQELIANHEVAIGMSVAEVEQSLGEPTKKSSRVTAKGRSGRYEYLTYEEQKHFQLVRDPRTGQVYRQLTHVTQEESGRLEIEFEDNTVVAIEESEDQGPGKIRIINPPIVFF